jgi:hypothetical protein
MKELFNVKVAVKLFKVKNIARMIKGVFGMTLLHSRAALLLNSGWSSSALEFRLFLITGGSGG